MVVGILNGVVHVHAAWTQSHPLIQSSTPTRATSRSRATFALKSTSTIAIYDAAELAAIEAFSSSSSSSSSTQSRQVQRQPPVPGRVGGMEVAAGISKEDPQTRLVGVVVQQQETTEPTTTAASGNNDNVIISLQDGTRLQAQSVATIPPKISDATAISTLVAALSSVHCAIPRMESVGDDSSSGSSSSTGPWVISGKVVVVGGGDYARFAADGLAALGADVKLVTTRRVQPNQKGVEVMGPSVGELELGFAAALGEFDCLVDTLGDEAKSGEPLPQLMNYDDDNDNDEEDEDDWMRGAMGGVIDLLKRRHNCHRYVSTLNRAQKIIRDEGLLFGPRMADGYRQEKERDV
eukprot:scaffold2856_cov47-Attheya_sp.AAC.1